MKQKQVYISGLITIVLVVAACIFIAIEPSGKLLDTILDNPLICFVGLVLITVIWFIVVITVDTAAKDKIYKKRPHLFEEMQSVLRATLLPLGFTEEEDQLGFIKEAKYSRDEFIVSLMTHIADLEYILSASSKSEIKDGQQSHILDFRVDGSLSKPDEFKSEAIAKLNAWLIEKNK